MNVWQPDSVLVLRVGNASYNTGNTLSGYAMPVFVDEYSPWGTPGVPYSSIALPDSACTLSYGIKPILPPYIWHDTSGFPALTADGTAFLMQCYGASAPGTQIQDATTVPKTIAFVTAAGIVDVRTSTTYPIAGAQGAVYPSAMHSVAAASYGSSIYTGWGGSASLGKGGYSLVPFAVATTVSVLPLLQQ